MRKVHILVAEDEKPIRAGVCKMLEDFFETLRPQALYAILETGSGSDAYRKCMTEEVDILITDIRMPTLSGVSLARRLVREGVPVHILAISGYQDYDYVRSMLKLGVYDYLLKPINQKQLWEAMEYFLDHITPTGAGRGAALQADQRMTEYLALRKGEQQEFESLCRRRGVSMDMGCQVFRIALDSQTRNRVFELYALVSENCGNYEDIVCIQGELDCWTVVCIYQRRISPEGFVDHLQAQLEQRGFRLLGTILLDSLEQVASLPRQLADSYYDIPAGEGMPPELRSCMERIEALILEEGDEEALAEWVAAAFARYQMEHTAADVIKRDFTDLTYRLMRLSADAIEFISKSKFTRYDLTEHLDGAATLSALREHVSASLIYLQQQMSRRRGSNTDAAVEQAVDYIGKNYDANLQLQQTAEHVHLHPNYLSTLFRRQMGMTFREYLRKVRVEAAKEHLAQGIPVSKVAELVGYGDTAHFFRAFKNVTGMTPKEYRGSRQAHSEDR